MRRSEVAELLGAANLLDKRVDASAESVAVWAEVIGDLEFGDAQAALVEHYKASRWQIMPVDFRERVKAARAARLERARIDAPSSTEPGEYREQLRRAVAAVASGRSLPAALEGPGPVPADQSTEWQQARGRDEWHRAGTVRCPRCQAGPGQACTSSANERLGKPHPSRVDAAEGRPVDLDAEEARVRDLAERALAAHAEAADDPRVSEG